MNKQQRAAVINGCTMIKRLYNASTSDKQRAILSLLENVDGIASDADGDSLCMIACGSLLNGDHSAMVNIVSDMHAKYLLINKIQHKSNRERVELTCLSFLLSIFQRVGIITNFDTSEIEVSELFK